MENVVRKRTKRTMLLAIILKPAPIRKLPRYRGFLVNAYGPPCASSLSFLIKPEAHVLMVSPRRIKGTPVKMVVRVGVARYKNIDPIIMLNIILLRPIRRRKKSKGLFMRLNLYGLIDQHHRDIILDRIDQFA